MNYYALFLDGDSLIEKCLLLIRLICNPSSRSFPHITLRVFKEETNKLDYIKDLRFSHILLTGTSSFNLDKGNPPYVVYIGCESDELEPIKHKPDYPLSRLHITLYEGNDIGFANSLFLLLSTCFPEEFQLDFESPKKLVEQKIGAHLPPDQFEKRVDPVFREYLGMGYLAYINHNHDMQSSLILVQKVLQTLSGCFDGLKTKDGITTIVPNSKPQIVNDQSANCMIQSSQQLNLLNLLGETDVPLIEKPVQDAIYITPPEYAKDMAECAMNAFPEDTRTINFGDSAIGTGSLFLALKHQVEQLNASHNRHYSIKSAIGIDIDKSMAQEAVFRCGRHGLQVVYGDAISPNTNIGPLRNLMIVNPPYNRHERIPKDYRLQSQHLAEEQTGIRIMGDAGLYVYHLLIMDKWLCQGAIAVWLLPSIFLQSRYGEAVRKYLLENVQLLQLHVYKDEDVQFDNTDISTTIVTFAKMQPKQDISISVSYGNSLSTPTLKKSVSHTLLSSAIKNWRRIVFNTENMSDYTENAETGIAFEHLFSIKRGLATGANSFFVMERTKARKIGIPSLALRPILPKARYINTEVVLADSDGYPCVTPQLVLIDCDLSEEKIGKQYPRFFDYLQSAKQSIDGAKAITERTLVKGRKPWYKQEDRSVPRFLLTYMGRDKVDRPPLYFILNKSNAVALNTYLLLYPQEWLLKVLAEDETLYPAVLTALNETAAQVLVKQTRVYAGGLQKIEPGELKKLPVIHLPERVLQAYKTHNGNRLE